MKKKQKKRRKGCSISVATLQRGIAGLFEAQLKPLAHKKNIDISVLENNDYDDFVKSVKSGAVHAVAIPIEEANNMAGAGLFKHLNNFEEQLMEWGAPLYYFGENVMGIMMTKNGNVLAAPKRNGNDITEEEFLEFLAFIIWLFCDKVARVKPIDKNSFDWEINGPGTVGEADRRSCSVQTYQVRYRAENSVKEHIIWNKVPPAGGRSVERTAIDDQGDSPTGKIASVASLEQGTWQVPFCSPGQFTMKVTVIWKCLLDGQVHLETKEKTITAR